MSDGKVISFEEIQRSKRVKSIEDRLEKSAKDLKDFLREHMSAKQALSRSNSPGNDLF